MQKTISIIIPVHNEEKNIALISSEITKLFLNLSYDYEIIFVNDGSNDNSGRIIEDLAKTDDRIKYIEFSRNFGKEMATTAGLHHSKGDCAIMIDADLQHPVEIIPKFITDWEKGFEVVVGIRKSCKSDTFIKIFGSKIFYMIMSRISDINIAPNSTDFRLVDRKVIDAFNQCTERTRITRGLIAWLGFRRSFIEFEANGRAHGEASYSTLKLIKLALSSFVSLSLFPLKIAGYLGIFITSLSGLLGLFIFIEKVILNDPMGFTWLSMLVVMNLFLIGIILSCLGLMALYIASINTEVSGRPMYVVRDKKGL
ncbi:MAG: glycosyltransferase family 2 protein [bacterium]|nr:glycosyltransferase family 2 protein [bacterium]